MGYENSMADALSRKQGSPILYHIFIPQVSLWEEIKQAIKEDQYIHLIGHVAMDQPKGAYAWLNGLLLYKGKVIIQANPSLRAKLLHEMLDTKVGGHSTEI